MALHALDVIACRSDLAHIAIALGSIDRVRDITLSAIHATKSCKGLPDDEILAVQAAMAEDNAVTEERLRKKRLNEVSRRRRVVPSQSAAPAKAGGRGPAAPAGPVLAGTKYRASEIFCSMS